MKFMMIVKASEKTEAGVLPTEQELSAMGEYNDRLIAQNLMVAGEGLHTSSKGTRVRVQGGKTRMIDGPFAETKELVAGFWVIDVGSKADAVAWAKQVPFTEGEVELRPFYTMADFGVPPEDDKGGWREREAEARNSAPARKPGTTRFMVLLKADKNTEASMMPSEELLTNMGALMEEYTQAGAVLAGEGLKPSDQGVRVRFAGDRRTVVDGPFTESKELVAGYTIVQFASKAEAVEFGRRMLQVHIDGTGIESGEVEIRQVFELEEFPVHADEKPDGWRKNERAFRDTQQ